MKEQVKIWNEFEKPVMFKVCLLQIFTEVYLTLSMVKQ